MLLYVTMPSGKQTVWPPSMLEKIVIDLCGGGYDEGQVRMALLECERLRRWGKTTIGKAEAKITLELKEVGEVTE